MQRYVLSFKVRLRWIRNWVIRVFGSTWNKQGARSDLWPVLHELTLILLLVIINSCVLFLQVSGYNDGQETATKMPQEIRRVSSVSGFAIWGEHERTTTAKNMGILKYHPTSLISYAKACQVGPWHAWTVLSNQTRPPIRVPGEHQVFLCWKSWL
jgi:hypothetical protein